MKKNTLFGLVLLLVLILTIASFVYRPLSASYEQTDRVEYAARTDSIDSTGSTNSIDGTGAGGNTETAPAFTVTDSAGETVSFSDFAGRPALLNFWASWCPPCRGELPLFQDAYDAHGEEIAFLMINLTDGQQETRERADAFLSENAYTFPVYYDTAGECVAAYQLYSIPLTVAVNAEGQIVQSQIGALTESAMQEFLEALL